MAEDSIPGILAEQCLGHEVPGIRGLHARAPSSTGRHGKDDLPDSSQHAKRPHPKSEGGA
jgi:hypothetical protein